jgi:hypothetical protein
LYRHTEGRAATFEAATAAAEHSALELRDELAAATTALANELKAVDELKAAAAAAAAADSDEPSTKILDGSLMLDVEALVVDTPPKTRSNGNSPASPAPVSAETLSAMHRLEERAEAAEEAAGRAATQAEEAAQRAMEAEERVAYLEAGLYNLNTDSGPIACKQLVLTLGTIK